MTLFPYDSIYEYVKTLKKDKKVLLCKKKVNSRLVSNIPADTRILDEENLTLLPKATKNPVEVENERIAHIRDGVAVTKFIYWLKKNVGRIPITELSAAEKLYEFRSEQEDFIDNSFDPIIAYGKHAAIVHYLQHPKQIFLWNQPVFFWQIQEDIIKREPLILPVLLSWDRLLRKRKSTSQQFCGEL